jgi:redox-sensitive bicupin YhaK (pirin superfamily)
MTTSATTRPSPLYKFRAAADRGHTKIDWLDSRHSFSFGSHYDPEWLGFRSLKVINDDHVAPSMGFATHGHRDMEIISLVLAGQLAHKDSLGTGSIILPGEIQRMSAGSGITHSEFNPSESDAVHFLQIWIEPQANGGQPSYQQAPYDLERATGEWQLLAAGSDSGDAAMVTIHQDARLWLARLDAGQAIAYPLQPGRAAWIQVVMGAVTVGEHQLGQGDGLGVENLVGLNLRCPTAADNQDGGTLVLLFDLA